MSKNAQYLSFEWSHTRVSSTDWNFRTIYPHDRKYCQWISNGCKIEVWSAYFMLELHLSIHSRFDCESESVCSFLSKVDGNLCHKGLRLTSPLLSLLPGNWSRLQSSFGFIRRSGYFLIHIYAPSALIVILSWISFCIPPDSTAARIALGITSVLTITTILNMLNTAMPKVRLNL